MIETERLILRELTADDYDTVHAYATDPEVVRYMPWGPNTPEETRAFLQRAMDLAEAEPRMDYEFAVVRKSDSVLLGAIGLHRSGSGGARAMVGYCFARSSWGHGYATEASRAVVRFAFEQLEVRRVWAGCDPRNLGSVGVLEKTGMKLEGHLREDTEIKGEWCDTLVYGLLRSEWSE